MTKVVILGAGFGGLQAALNLEKKFGSRSGVKITLIDQQDYHLFAPNLFEVATAEEELVSVSQLKDSIALPLKKILSGTNISFICSRAEEIRPQSKQVKITGKTVDYDYLILALGSQSDFFEVEGAQQYALPLKNFRDAIRIRNRVEMVFQNVRLMGLKHNIRLVVAGGGYSGLELVGELHGLVKYLIWKYQVPPQKVEIEVIEASPKLAAGFDDRLSQDAYNRLMRLGLRVSLSSRIAKVEPHFVQLVNGERIAYDVLVWSTGVKANSMSCSVKLDLDPKQRICVNQYLQVHGQQNIFALGDVAQVLDSQGQPVPSSAQDAIDQAAYLPQALKMIMKNRLPEPYKNKKHGFIVTLGGKWAILSYPPFYFTGWLAYLVDLAAHAKYYASLVGWWQAIKAIVFQAEIYSRND